MGGYHYVNMDGCKSLDNPITIYPEEFAGLVLTIVGGLAFTYGAILYLRGVSNVLTVVLIAVGGFVGIASVVWLVVIYQVKDIVSD